MGDSIAPVQRKNTFAQVISMGKTMINEQRKKKRWNIIISTAGRALE